MKQITHLTPICHNPSIHNAIGDRKTQHIINGLTFEDVTFLQKYKEKHFFGVHKTF
jgi:hypothetical protein